MFPGKDPRHLGHQFFPCLLPFGLDLFLLAALFQRPLSFLFQLLPLGFLLIPGGSVEALEFGQEGVVASRAPGFGFGCKSKGALEYSCDF